MKELTTVEFWLFLLKLKILGCFKTSEKNPTYCLFLNFCATDKKKLINTCI
jgi:hypothetical protein